MVEITFLTQYFRPFLSEYLSGHSDSSGCFQIASREVRVAPDSHLVDQIQIWNAEFKTLGGNGERFFSKDAQLQIQDASPSRQMEWAEGRRALITVMEGLELQDAQTYLSLSHSKNTVLAVGIQAQPEKLFGIGLDFEFQGRPMNPKAQEKIVSEIEIPFLGPPPLLSVLDFWVLKEACYKANPRSVNTVVSHYQVSEFDPQAGRGHARSSDADFSFALYRDSTVTIALAVCNQLK